MAPRLSPDNTRLGWINTPTTTTDWTRVDRRRARAPKRYSAAHTQKLLEYNDLFQTKPFEKFYYIKFPGFSFTENINPIATERDLKTALGQVSKITQASRDSLLS